MRERERERQTDRQTDRQTERERERERERETHTHTHRGRRRGGGGESGRQTDRLRLREDKTRVSTYKRIKPLSCIFLRALWTSFNVLSSESIFCCSRESFNLMFPSYSQSSAAIQNSKGRKCIDVVFCQLQERLEWVPVWVHTYTRACVQACALERRCGEEWKEKMNITLNYARNLPDVCRDDSTCLSAETHHVC